MTQNQVMHSEKTYKKTAKVSFVKLPNETEMQTYGYPSIPLTLDMYIQNILADYPFMFVNLQGTKQLNNNAILTYNTNFSFSKSYYNSQFIQSIPWQVGYFGNRLTVEIGQTNSSVTGASSGGNGIKTSYRLNNHNMVSAFYSISKNQNNETNNEIV